MIGLATLALGVGYAWPWGEGGYWLMLPVIAFLGGLWLGLSRSRWGWIHSIALLIYIGLAALGALLRLPAGWMLLCLAAALSAWDLAYFLRRVSSVEREEIARLLARQHLQRLGLVIGLGLLLAGAALILQARFTLGVALLAGLLAILTISQVIAILRRESD